MRLRARAAILALFLKEGVDAFNFSPAAARLCRDESRVFADDSNTFADALSRLVTNSPINEAKKVPRCPTPFSSYSPLSSYFLTPVSSQGLVKMLAGPYNEEATKEKLLGLISSEPVLMLSFTK